MGITHIVDIFHLGEDIIEGVILALDYIVF